MCAQVVSTTVMETSLPSSSSVHGCFAGQVARSLLILVVSVSATCFDFPCKPFSFASIIDVCLII